MHNEPQGTLMDFVQIVSKGIKDHVNQTMQTVNADPHFRKRADSLQLILPFQLFAKL